ncbi:hypothetical protein PbB2_00998 [Candidatus Phycosocius bacilliformis]|uniref:Uncharacterized protein n=1 Tax=Candidatus Phycosocius bacilliformis TaxID=1445552 RepID=A0A2P2E8E4_9PROT|nr:hypothetical protein PbB2_00998 [Candidatus Phycosocius bacilliformis]
MWGAGWSHRVQEIVVLLLSRGRKGRNRLNQASTKKDN